MNFNKQELVDIESHRQAYDRAQKAGLSLWHLHPNAEYLYLSKIDDALYSQNCVIIAQGSLSDLILVIDRYWNLKAFL
jgi:hypothetical protein